SSVSSARKSSAMPPTARRLLTETPGIDGVSCMARPGGSEGRSTGRRTPSAPAFGARAFGKIAPLSRQPCGWHDPCEGTIAMTRRPPAPRPPALRSSGRLALLALAIAAASPGCDDDPGAVDPVDRFTEVLPDSELLALEVPGESDLAMADAPLAIIE